MLYVANTTKQHHMFLYRIPGEAGIRQQHIPSGNQARIYNNTDLDTIWQIVKQHEAYGLVPENEVPVTKEFIGLCFSIDKPIDIDRLLHAFDHNNQVMDEVAAERRETMSATIASELENTLGVPMDNVTVEIKEQVKGMETPRLEVGVEVARDPSKARHTGDRRPPSGRRVKL